MTEDEAIRVREGKGRSRLFSPLSLLANDDESQRMDE